MDSFVIVLGLVTFVLAGFVKGVIGLGLPTVAIGLLSLAVTPATAAAVLVIPSLVTNVWQMVAGPDLVPLVRRLWPMLLAVVVGTIGGTILIGAPGPGAVPVLGVVLIAYAALGLTSLRLAVPPQHAGWLGPVVGLATGVVTAATGVFVIPAVPYLTALGLAKDDLVQALGLSFTVSTVALGAGLLHDRVLDGPVALVSLAALVPAAAGMLLGQWLRARVSPATFRIGFFVGLLLLGTHLALSRLW